MSILLMCFFCKPVHFPPLIHSLNCDSGRYAVVRYNIQPGVQECFVLAETQPYGIIYTPDMEDVVGY